MLLPSKGIILNKGWKSNIRYDILVTNTERTMATAQ